MSATTKRQILAEWLADQAANTKAGLIVEQRFRAEALNIYADLGAQRSIMGGSRNADIFYADVLLRGNAQPIGNSRDVQYGYDYDVRLWLEYEDDESSPTQDTFDALTYGTDGIVTTLLGQGSISSTTGTAQLDQTLRTNGLNEQVALDELHDSPSVLAHLLTFTITLR